MKAEASWIVKSVVLALVAVLPGCKSLDAQWLDYVQMRGAGDGLLLVGHTPSALTGYKHLGRVAWADKEGKIRHAIDERVTFSVEGIDGDTLWLTRSTPTGDISAHTIPSLAPAPGLAEAIAGHPVLSNTYVVKGVFEGKAVLEGPNSKLYSLDKAGTIAKLPSDTAVSPKPPIEGSSADQVRLPLEPVPKNTEAGKAILDALDNATQFSNSAALLGGGTSDVLVKSTVYTKGSTSAQLSRIDSTGKVVWAATLAELAAPISVKDAQIELVSVTQLGDEAWLLIRAFRQDRSRQEDYYEVEHKIVRLDPAAGTAAAAHTVSDGR